jgi:hypothetical protein
MAVDQRSRSVAVRLLAMTAVAGVALVAGACGRATGNPSGSVAAGGSTPASAPAAGSTGSAAPGGSSGSSGAPLGTGGSTRGTGGFAAPHQFIPATAKAVVVVYDDRGLGVVTDRDQFGPVTITDSAKIAGLVNLVNSAAVATPQVRACPMIVGGGQTMHLQFLSGVGGATVGTVTISASPCLGMITNLPSKPRITLVGGPDTIVAVEKILGVTWPTPGK